MADLIERDAALEKIETLRRAYILHAPAGMGGMSAICHCRDSVNEIPAVNRWIPCSERMPETPHEGFGVHFHYSDCVLVAAKDWLGMAYYVTENGESRWEFADARTMQVIDWIEITHWMPLPEPPKEDET